MPFNSIEYLLFFIAVLCVSWLLVGKPQLRILFLSLASYYFYASNNGWLLVLLLGSTAIDYFAAHRIEATGDTRQRKLWLTASLVTNLGMLGVFKYFNFFIGTAQSGASLLGFDLTLPQSHILLPVGISFYTFQSMSYTIDVYSKKLKAERSFIRFAFFVSFFPQLVAGPIVRARYFLHQIPETPRLSMKAFEASLFLIFTGLFKKMVLGDTLGDYADLAFSSPDTTHAFVAWLGLYAFTFQIYFDFSGYTDIAIGCARLLGFRLPPNFRRPYTATSFSEFWRRWHISLSFWLRDYLYKPLGGNRKGDIRAYANLMITMLLGGLWHGANWTFIIWGGLHGLFLAIEKRLGLAKFSRDYHGKPIQRFFRSFIIFNLIVLTWLPFRATDFSHFIAYTKALFHFEQSLSITLGMLLAICIILGALGAQWFGELKSIKRLVLQQPFILRALFYAGIIILIIVFSARGTEPFIYFRF